MRKFIHRAVWPRLPRTARRKLLMGMTEFLAPRPDPKARHHDPLIVAGFLRACSGLGEGARLTYDALRACGASVAGIDLSDAMMQDQDRADFHFEDGSRCEGPGTLLLHVNPPWLPMALMAIGRKVVHGKRIVGYWAWELPAVPPDWREAHRFVHDVWVPSSFVAEAVGRHATQLVPRVIPHAVALHAPAVSERHYGDRGHFVVLVVFDFSSSLTRKNPLAAIAAFRAAFADDPTARLIVKATHSERYPQGLADLVAACGGASNIEILTRSLEPQEMEALYRSADAVLSLHRSEGFGLVVAEAMLRGLPVVATDWSGSTDFLTCLNGMPVRWRPLRAMDPQGIYDQPGMSWADADIADASMKLRDLRRDPELRAQIGRRARKDALERFGIERYCRSVAQALHPVVMAEIAGEDRSDRAVAAVGGLAEPASP